MKVGCICFFKQKTAYEMRISDWSSDVCSSDLALASSAAARIDVFGDGRGADEAHRLHAAVVEEGIDRFLVAMHHIEYAIGQAGLLEQRSEERRVGKECVRTGSYRWSASH